MAIELWESADLMEVTYADGAAPPDGFWLGDYGRLFTSEKRKIYFDDIAPRDRRLAPFVAPNVQGRVMRSRGRTLSSFEPAYVKPKHIVDPTKALVRRPGEPLSTLAGVGIGSDQVSLEARFDAHVADNMRSEREMIERRWDWMACQATVYGKVTVSGEDYPTREVDFLRDPSLTQTLLGGAKWDQTTSDKLANIRVMRKNAFELGQAPVRKLVFGTDAAEAFLSDEVIQERLLNTQRRGNESTFNATGIGDDTPVEYLGYISGPNGAGRLELYSYSNKYEDDDGVMQDYLDPRDVVGIGGGLQGVRAFGAIMDKRAGLRALPIFPKMWEEEDPSVVYTMSQSAPLMVPVNTNNTFRMRVL